MSLTEFDEEEFVRNRREEDAQQAKLETAKNLFAMKILSEAQIASATGLSLEEVEKISSEMN